MGRLTGKLIDLGLGIIDRIPIVGDATHDELNRAYINDYAHATEPRPRAFSQWSPVPGPEKKGEPPPDPSTPNYITDYTSWPGLVDKSFSGRHLPPAPASYIESLPEDARYKGQDAPLGDVTELFARRGAMTPSRSSLLFAFFAQWFTDSILRTHPYDRRKNTSNHDIDLCQIYGLHEETTRILRGGRDSKDGLLWTREVDGEEYLDRLCEPDGAGGFRIRDRYAGLSEAQRDVDGILQDFKSITPSRKEHLYATGLERGNSSIGYVALSTVFAREHNRIARELKKNNRGWDDERLFQTARVINIVIELKLLVEEYINHIIGHRFFRLDHSFAEKQHWYRANWMAVEFDLLYRWHGLVPDVIQLTPDDPSGPTVDARTFRNNVGLFEKVGLAKVLDAASKQPAGKVGLGNTPDFLWGAENAAIAMGRSMRLRSYNDYREHFRLPRCADFGELTSDPELQAKLERLYRKVDNVEFYVGIFAEDREDDGLLFGRLLNRIVAYDAFTQIFSNPLLSVNIYGESTFTDYGLELIEKTTSLQALCERNIQDQDFVASLGYVEPKHRRQNDGLIEVGHVEEIPIDTHLGEEKRPDEDRVALRIAASIRDRLERGVKDGKPIVRDAHPKSHGLVRAVFRVEDELAPQLARGVFQPGKSFEAWIRFSNGNADPRRSDKEGDSRGMAIKLLGVEGAKVLPRLRTATTQDFLLIDHPTFIVDDAKDYLDIVSGEGSRNPAKAVGALAALGAKGFSIFKKISSQTVGSPLEARYWSTTAYALGTGADRVAVKYSVRPQRARATPIPEDPPPDFLRQTMKRQLSKRDYAFDFLVQVRSGSDMSVESTREEWPEADAPFQKVATITIPKQTFATASQDDYGESLSFNPWHALVEHRPLGGVNRVRRIVYEQIARFRRHDAGESHDEPTEMRSFGRKVR